MVDIEYCIRCMLGQSENKVLEELATSKNRSLRNINRQIDRYESIKEEAEKQREKRLAQRKEMLAKYEQELKQHEEELSYSAADEVVEGEDVEQIAQNIMEDKTRQELERAINSLKYQPEDINYNDVEAALREYEKQGYINIERDQIKITPKGARLLAKHALKRALERLAKEKIGPHPLKETGYGSEVSIYSKRYELGDEYHLVDIEKTLLNSLERCGEISLKLEDFQVFETVHQTRMCAGLIIDESGSMESEQKIGAAINASLALSELIRRNPKDSLKAFVFSEEVKEIPSWDIVNSLVARGSTDIRAAMRAFRKAVINEKGDKQAYLITDSEPNTEDGTYVGFERAMGGVLQEAMRYREKGITLNIIMLDERPSLKSFARILARKNLGRVFFTSPQDLGGVIIEDYLSTRKERGKV